MEFNHPKLSQVQYLSQDIVTFPQGLLGYLKLKRYLILKEKNYTPFLWMVSTDNPEISVVLIDPRCFHKTYAPNITRRDLNELSAENPQSLEMYSIVTMNEDPTLSTANLSGPILVNQVNKIGKQLVLLDDRYSTRHRILNM